LTNDTTRLLGIEGVEVTSVELDELGNPLLALVTAAETVRCCPECGQVSRYPHSWVRTRPRDLPVAGRPSVLTWTKRRWRCLNPVCARATFTERVPQIPPRHRLTARLREAAGAAVGDGGRTVEQSARDHRLSWPVVNAAVRAHAEAALPASDPQVEALGIDEIRRGRAKWRWDEKAGAWETVVDRWHVGFVDLTGGAGLLGQVEGRNAACVSAWIEAHDPTWHAAVAFVAIDLCSIFKAAIRQSLPNAVILADRFHVAQLANQALKDVRRRVTVQQRGRRGRKGDREWELRNRLTRSAAATPARLLDPMVDDLRALPKKIGEPIAKAWNCKEDLMDLLALTGTNPPRSEIYRRLERFYTSCAASGQPELERLARTVSAWRNEIIAGIATGISNAGSEGHNRVIKTDARCAYGYRNPANQRIRTRLATTRRGRGCLKHDQVR
jgi:transposase